MTDEEQQYREALRDLNEVINTFVPEAQRLPVRETLVRFRESYLTHETRERARSLERVAIRHRTPGETQG